MSSQVTETRGFWNRGPSVSSSDVLNALQDFRDAETSAQQRACRVLGIGDNALHALRFLRDEGDAGRSVNAKDVAVRLGVTAASTSTLVDRLVRAGYVERRPDPDDRRGILLSVTGPSAYRVHAVVAELDERRLDAVAGLPPESVSVVLRFLADMTRAVEQLDTVPTGMDKSS